MTVTPLRCSMCPLPAGHLSPCDLAAAGAAYERAFDEPTGIGIPDAPHDKKVPRGPEIRAQERANELEALAFAYRVLKHVGPPGTINHRAACITLEALKAWERAHPPAALDPLLLPQAQEIPGVTRLQRVPQPGDLDYPDG